MSEPELQRVLDGMHLTLDAYYAGQIDALHHAYEHAERARMEIETLAAELRRQIEAAESRRNLSLEEDLRRQIPPSDSDERPT